MQELTAQEMELISGGSTAIYEAGYAVGKGVMVAGAVAGLLLALL